MDALAKELECLYRTSSAQLFHCALAVTLSGSLAEDAVHNAFQRAFRLKRCPDNLRAYMFRSVRNAAIDLIRRESRTISIEPETLFEMAPSQLQETERFDLLEQVSSALAHLGENERETVIQYLVGHLTFQEIADLKERPLGTITSWYRRGLTKLKELIKHEYGPN